MGLFAVDKYHIKMYMHILSLLNDSEVCTKSHQQLCKSTDHRSQVNRHSLKQLLLKCHIQLNEDNLQTMKHLGISIDFNNSLDLSRLELVERSFSKEG